MPSPLSPGERNRLVGILGRLGSDHARERAAAGLLAARLLRNRGLSWDDLIADGGGHQEAMRAPRPDLDRVRHMRPLWTSACATWR